MKHIPILDLSNSRTAKSKLTIVISWLLLGAALVSSNHVFAEEKEWFFDIEVIVYKRNQVPSELAEQFLQGLNQVDTSQTYDLFAPFVKPDLSIILQHLPVCGAVAEAPIDLTLPSQWDLSVLSPIEWDPNWFSVDHLQHETLELQTITEPEQEELQADVASELVEEVPLNELTEEMPVPLLFEIKEVPPIEYREQLGCIEQSMEPHRFYADRVPVNPQMSPVADYKQPQLLSDQEWQLSDLAKSINRQRGLQVMLHTAWRQQVLFGRENGPALRLYAGTNFAKDFAADGHRLHAPQTVDESLWSSQGADLNNVIHDTTLIDQIRLALASSEPLVIDQQQAEISAQQQTEIDELWELDGSLAIFLRYINRTPYLHVDGNLDFRAPIFSEVPQLSDSTTQPLPEPDRLQSYGFSQLRRVISTQVHYFDHPMFGLIVQIRRYDMPTDTSEQDPN